VAFVVDASVTLAWFIDGEATPFTEAVLSRLDAESAFVPPIWTYEVANVLMMSERRGCMTRAQVTAALDRLRGLPIEVDEDSMAHAWDQVLELARQFNLSVYDASYLDLAGRLRLALATNDDRMRGAALGFGLAIVRDE
jgi:predicted nucleic acid-binding protein